GARYGSPGWRATWRVPFSSARRWSGAGFDGAGHWVLGAPDTLLAAASDRAHADEAAALVDEESRRGRRVLLLVRLAGPPTGEAPGKPPTGTPAGVPAAVVAIEERVRPTARDTLAYFAAQGVAVK